MKANATALAAGGLLFFSIGASVAAADKEGRFTCPPVPDPVVKLDYGSRYKGESSSRSDLDEQANAEVDRALEPVDEFVSELSELANAAFVSDEDRSARAACALSWLDTWAGNGALTELDSFNARLSVAPRIAGMAIALWQVQSAVAVPPASQKTIGTWLVDRAHFVEDVFEEEAGRMSSRNNLRAWAGLAATAVGLAADDVSLLDWGAKSFAVVACSASPDGSLPQEMKRKHLALHYQLHALNALAMTAFLLEESGREAVGACNGSLERIVAFTLRAVQDNSIVEEIAGREQSYDSGEDRLEAFELAWAEPYLSMLPDPELEAFVAPRRPLGNTKLGGNLTEMFASRKD